jgi:hypothetical protein
MFSAIRWGDMRVTTNAPGAYAGITVNMTSNPIPLTPGYQLLENLHFTGVDYTISNPPTHYWSTALSLAGLSIVNFNNITLMGGGSPSNPQGLGIHLNGPPGLPANPGAAAVIFNFSNILAGYLDTGIMYDSQTSGAHVEGISIVASNFQSNRYGIRGPTIATGLSELAITNSQFGDNQTAAIQAGANVGDMLVSNNLFELGSGQIGILGGSIDLQITGNSFASQAAGSNIGTGVSLDVSAANCFGHITSNTFTNLQYGITVTSAATCAAVQLVRNLHIGSTTMYNITGGSGINIDDNQGIYVAQLPTYNNTIIGSMILRIVDLSSGAGIAGDANNSGAITVLKGSSAPGWPVGMSFSADYIAGARSDSNYPIVAGGKGIVSYTTSLRLQCFLCLDGMSGGFSIAGVTLPPASPTVPVSKGISFGTTGEGSLRQWRDCLQCTIPYRSLDR